MKYIKYLLYLMLPVLLLVVPSCEQDIPNPNAATDEQILNSTDGLVGMINGMKFRYTNGGASGLYSAISANGLTTGELVVLNAGNADLAQLGNGLTNVAPNNSVISNLWTNLNLLRADAEKVLDNAPRVIQDAGTRAGALAYANLFKALALGTMAQFWEQVPLVTAPNAKFSSRTEALNEAVRLLDEASQQAATAFSTDFNTRVGTDINIVNAAKALSARYNLMLGNLDAANTAASAVDLASTSVFKFDNVVQNPVYRSSLITNNVYDAKLQFGLSGNLTPDPADGRIAFYLTPNATNGKGFFTADNASIPLYLPGEMTLIKAEVAARQNRLGDAVTELDKILTKATDPLNVTAKLPAYNGGVTQAEILQEIYRNRCIELFMSGLKLEDSRRFNRPGPNEAGQERNRNFYPYPTIERDNNPDNTPPDPSV